MTCLIFFKITDISPSFQSFGILAVLLMFQILYPMGERLISKVPPIAWLLSHLDHGICLYLGFSLSIIFCFSNFRQSLNYFSHNELIGLWFTLVRMMHHHVTVVDVVTVGCWAQIHMATSCRYVTYIVCGAALSPTGRH